MSFLKNLFTKKEEQTIKLYADFWTWFEVNQRSFYKVVKERGNIERDFFNKVSPQLRQISDGIFLLTGMCDENTVELVLTPDGNIKKIVFAEEIVDSAPNIEGWKFTALKPDVGHDGFCLTMGDHKISVDNLRFYSRESWEHPDEIDIIAVHDEITEENKDRITNSIYLYLDNFLGERQSIATIDKLTVSGKSGLEPRFQPVSDIKAYLSERQRTFVEKYEGSRFNTDADSFVIMEGELANGNPWIAVINTTLLMWDSKPSHPWVAGIQFKYADNDRNGLPGDTTLALLNKIEEEILAELQDFEGYLNVGRETAENARAVYFACNDFRKPSKVFDCIQKKYSQKLTIDFDIYKDKYWQTFDRFLPAQRSSEAN